jgi:hypothetical protein
MVMRQKSPEEKERLGAIAHLIRSGKYPLDPQRLAETLLGHPLARDRLGLQPEQANADA